jgi:hypothetical protein
VHSSVGEGEEVGGGRVIAVDGANHFLKDGAEAIVLFLRDAQLVLRSSVLTVLL